MRLTATLALLLCATLTAQAAPAAAAQAAAPAGWKMDQLMISAWGGPETDDQARAYVDAGLNTVMVKAASLDVCRRAGLRALVFDGSPEMAAAHKDDPAVWGWYVRDEPTAELFGEMGKLVAPYHEADPNHPAYVNLMAWMPLDQYFDAVKPRFLSYDYYQWWWGPGNYCGRLAAHRAAALAHHVPLICWVEANADPRYEWGRPGAGYLDDNAAKLRQSVNLALAYGVTGIQWFTAGLILSPGPDGNLVLSQSGQDIKVINYDLAALGPALLPLTSTAVGHTTPIPEHCGPVPQDAWLKPQGSFATVGYFTDPAGGEYAFVVNRHLSWSRTFTLSFAAPVRALARFDCSTGQWSELPTTRDLRRRPAVRLTLGPGDGALLKALP
jgi:hypothetical protein